MIEMGVFWFDKRFDWSTSLFYGLPLKLSSRFFAASMFRLVYSDSIRMTKTIYGTSLQHKHDFANGFYPRDKSREDLNVRFYDYFAAINKVSCQSLPIQLEKILNIMFNMKMLNSYQGMTMLFLNFSKLLVCVFIF